MNVSYLLTNDMRHIGHAGTHTHERGDFDEPGCSGFSCSPLHTDASTDPNWSGQKQEARRWAGLLDCILLTFERAFPTAMAMQSLSKKNRSFSIALAGRPHPLEIRSK